jgi:hypothetical protein
VCFLAAAFDASYVRGKEAVLGDVMAITAVMFALPGLRTIQPGIPKDVGVTADILGCVLHMYQ